MILAHDRLPELDTITKTLIRQGTWALYALERGGYLLIIPHEGCCNRKVTHPYLLLDHNGHIEQYLEHRPSFDIRDTVTFLEEK